MTTPRYGSYHESKISAFRGAERVAFGRRQAVHHRFEHLGDADAFFRAGENGARSVEADDLLDLPPRFLGLRARQIDLVDDRE